jgi:Rhs element Vgr protein
MLRFTQASRLLRLHTPLGDDVLLAESLHGEEGIGEGFRLQVSALSTDAGLPLKALLGQPVLLELEAPMGVRPFHGHVTACELCGADGGFARYLLVIEPWTAFLKLGRDSRAYQDQSVIDIVDAVFAGWNGKGALAPAWRFEVDRSLYPLRSLTTQYQESDFAFISRLLSEEGLFGYFEHTPDAHTFVIADSNDAYQSNPQPLVRFTQPGATMRADSVDRWRTEARRGAPGHQRHRPAQLGLPQPRPARRDAGGRNEHELRSADIPGAYAYISRQRPWSRLIRSDS